MFGGLFGKDKKKEEEKRAQAWQQEEAETEERLRKEEARQEMEAEDPKPPKQEEKQPLEITKDTLIGQILAYDMNIADILIANGMACTGCMAAYGESLEMACYVHGIPVDGVLEDIHEYEARKKKAKAGAAAAN